MGVEIYNLLCKKYQILTEYRYGKNDDGLSISSQPQYIDFLKPIVLIKILFFRIIKLIFSPTTGLYILLAS